MEKSFYQKNKDVLALALCGTVWIGSTLIWGYYETFHSDPVIAEAPKYKNQEKKPSVAAIDSKKFTINKDITDELTDGETDILKDGTRIGIREIIPPAEDRLRYVLDSGKKYLSLLMPISNVIFFDRIINEEFDSISKGQSSYSSKEAYLDSIDKDGDQIFSHEELDDYLEVLTKEY